MVSGGRFRGPQAALSAPIAAGERPADHLGPISSSGCRRFESGQAHRVFVQVRGYDGAVGATCAGPPEGLVVSEWSVPRPFAQLRVQEFERLDALEQPGPSKPSLRARSGSALGGRFDGRSAVCSVHTRAGAHSDTPTLRHSDTTGQMMRTDTRDIVSVSDAAKNFSRYASEVAEGRSIVIVRNNEPTAALVPLDRMDRLDKLDELEEDLLLWGIALARTITDSGERHSLEDVAAEFGVDLDDDGESVEEH